MRTIPVLASLVLAVTAATALADPVVLGLDGQTAIIDVGARDGVGPGTELELVHEIVATDPVTKQTLRDAFALGALTVTRAGAHVCQASIEPDLRGRVAVGDRIRVVSDARTFADPWEEQVLASKRGPTPPDPAGAAPAGTDPYASAAAAVTAAEAATARWHDTLGKPPRERVALWTGFLAAHPGTPYAAAIKAEIASLAAQAVALDAAVAAAKAAATDADAAGARRPDLVAALGELAGAPGAPMYAAVPEHVSPGRPVEVTFTVARPLAAIAWLYVRPAGAASYQRVPLIADGDAYLRATIDAALVTGARLDWYVADGDRAILGDDVAPRSIVVDAELTEPPPARGRTQVHTSLDYVDFDGGLNAGFDQYVQAELDFAYQFRSIVHTARVGFGTMSGTGGPKDIIDADPNKACLDATGTFRCRAVTFSYVYTEFEFRPRPQLAVMLRPQAGLLTTDRRAAADPGRCADVTDTTDCAFGRGYGLRARVRIGDEAGTNLELGAGFTDGVGTLFEALYNWAPTPRVPVKLAVQVTDLPVPEDFGVRLLADVGWRGVAWVYPSVRVSYQARDIDHVGMSGGVGLNFDW